MSKPRSTRRIVREPRAKRTPPPQQGRGPNFGFKLYPDDQYYPQLCMWLDAGYTVRDIFDALMDAYQGQPPPQENLTARTLERLEGQIGKLSEVVEKLEAGGFAAGIPGGMFIQAMEKQKPIEEEPLPDAFFSQLNDVGGTAFFEQ